MSDARPAPPRSTRLGVGHLLIWTAGCAVALAVTRGVSLLDPRDAPLPLAAQAAQVGYAMVYGAALGAVGLFIWRRLRGDRATPLEPGHWMLLLAAAGALFDFGTHVAARWWLGGESMQYSFDSYTVSQTAAHGLAALVAVAILLGMRAEPRWRLCFFAIALLCALTSATHALFLPPIFRLSPVIDTSWFRLPEHLLASGSVGCAAVGIQAVWVDLRQHTERDWLHWSGIGVGLCLALLNWIDYAIWV